MNTAATVLRLDGELTIHEAAALRERLLLAGQDAGTATLVLDLAGIEAIDSAGVQLLLATQQWQRTRGAQLALGDCSSGVKQALQLYGLTNQFSRHAQGANA